MTTTLGLPEQLAAGCHRMQLTNPCSLQRFYNPSLGSMNVPADTCRDRYQRIVVLMQNRIPAPGRGRLQSGGYTGMQPKRVQIVYVAECLHGWGCCFDSSPQHHLPQ